MGKKRLIDYAREHNLGLRTINQVLNILGFKETFSPNYRISEEDVIFLDKILLSSTAEKYFEAIDNLFQAEKKLCILADLPNAKISSTSNFTKKYLYEQLLKKYEKNILKFNILSNCEYSEENLTILHHMDLLDVQYEKFAREAEYLHMGYYGAENYEEYYDEYYEQKNDLREKIEAFLIEARNYHIKAKKYMLQKQMSHTDFSEKRFEMVFSRILNYDFYISSHEYDEEIIVEQKKVKRRELPDYEEMTMRALAHGEADAFGF